MTINFCPVCQYPLRRADHPQVGQIRFCRTSCINEWNRRRGLPLVNEGLPPYGIDRRVAVDATVG